MIADALLAYVHFISIFLLFAFLSVEAVVLRNPPDAAAIRLVSRIDLFYFGSAMLVLASGLLRLFWGAKGASFYTANPVFLAKLALFIVIGGLSVLPTLQFVRWARTLKMQPDFTPGEAERKKARRMVMIEIHLASLLPLLAVFMSRGIGFN